MSSDKVKTRLSIFFFLAMIVLPGVVLAIGWIGWDLRVGAIASLVTLVICFLAAGLLLAMVNDLSWLAVAAPLCVAFIYTTLPDFVAGTFDDAAVMTAGVLMTFTLWLRKQPEAPRWIVIPLLMSAVYTLIGGFIPGPVDDLLVAGIGIGTAALGAVKKRVSLNEPQAAEIEALSVVAPEVRGE